MSVKKGAQWGLVGLRNLGNTCFMNSCLQCLSNTAPLTRYFLDSCFEYEINRTNTLGTKGKLAKAYAKFIRGMWCETDSVYVPDNVKSAVSSINHIFSGYSQHDSHEFFSFLIDGLHEDLNRIAKKPYF
jgi:ubiquitin carboxyl-terminal hydrolase 4/11/15